MPDIRKQDGSATPSLESQHNHEGTPDEAIPFIAPDDSANMQAIQQLRQRADVATLEAGNAVFVPLDYPKPSTASASQTAKEIEAARQAALEGGSPGMASGAATITLVPDWGGLVSRLDTIEAGLQSIASKLEEIEAAYRSRPGIGHNNPPEDIETLPLSLADVRTGILAAKLARDEANADNPRLDVIRLCGYVLNQIAKSVFRFLHWLAEKGELFLNEFVKSAGQEAGKLVKVGGVFAILYKIAEELHVNLNETVDMIKDIFEHMHSPF